MNVDNYVKARFRDVVQPGIIAGSCRPLIFLYIGNRNLFYRQFKFLSKSGFYYLPECRHLKVGLIILYA
jgi:hypothetical protein